MPDAPDSTSHAAVTPVPSVPLGWKSRPAIRYPDHAVWFVLFSSMDVMLTWVILSVGGSEANPIARLVIDAWGLPGAIAFKFSLTLAVIIICETIGRQRERLGRTIMNIAIGVSVTPVLYSILLLAFHIVYF